MDPQVFALQVFINGLLSSMLYILIALGLTVIFSILNIVNFAHGEFYMLGAYVLYYLFTKAHIPYFVSIVLSMLIVGVIGWLIERGLFRLVRGLELSALIISLGILNIIANAAQHLFGEQDKSTGTAVAGVTLLFRVNIPLERIVVMASSFALILMLFYVIHRTKLGKAMRAVAQNRYAAALQGISIDGISSLGFGIGCALAAGAGAIAAPLIYLSPGMGLSPCIKAFVVIIIGGMGSIPGAVVGGLVLGFVEAITQGFTSAVWSQVIAFAILILVLIFKPTGLLGYGER